MGLKALLQDALNGIAIEVMPCVTRKATIPPDQRSVLGVSGYSLGRDTYLGKEIEDRMGKFRLQIGPVDREQYYGLLPGHPHHERLVFLTDLYVSESLEYDLELTMLEEEMKTACLGGPQGASLGWDTWVFSWGHLGEVRAVFYPERG